MPQPSYQLRAARLADRKFLWSLKRQTMRPYIEQTWGTWNNAEQQAYFLKSFSAEALNVIMFEGRDAGMLEVIRKRAEIFLGNIAVLPEFQSHGIGSSLIKDLQAEAKTAGLPLHLQVLKVNPRAQQLYTRLGFRLVGETITHHLMAWPS
jgi:ribosomal protein S18 acetylase RimI-like enzyme